MKILVVLFIYLFFRAKRENPLRIILLVSLKKKKKKKPLSAEGFGFHPYSP